MREAARASDEIQRFGAIVYVDHALREPALFERVQRKFRIPGIILNQQNVHLTPG